MNFGGRPGAAPAKLASRAPELRERRATLCLLQPGRQQPRTASVWPTPLVAPRGGGAGAGRREGRGAGRGAGPGRPQPQPQPAAVGTRGPAGKGSQVTSSSRFSAGRRREAGSEGRQRAAHSPGAARQHECAVTGGTAGEAAWYTRERPDSRGTCCLRHH